MNTILLNSEPYHFTEQSLPLLIHGKDHVGASLFTVTFLADLYKQGSKILILSGYPYAREEFLKQTNAETNVAVVENNNISITEQSKQVIFLLKENAEFFVRLTQVLSDINDRVILIKNIDLFDEAVLEAVEKCKKLVISGDIDKVPYKERLLARNYVSKIYFSQPSFGGSVPLLDKWHGYLQSTSTQGDISLKI